MAKKDSGSSSKARAQGKRLARAKVKAPEEQGKAAGRGARKDGAAGRKGRAAKPKLTLAEARARRKKRVTAAIVIAFAILMALSMMLPSFSAIFANRNAQKAAEQEQDQSSSDDSSSDSGSQPDTGTVAGVDAEYQPLTSDLEAKLADDPQDLATLLGLGNDYMNWGYQVARLASGDDDAAHASDLLAKAEGYYDQYLALNDSPMVRTNRALCQFYSGDTEGATAALQQLTQNDPDFGPAWANLGLMYEVSGDADAAKNAYGKAEDADPDDEYGAKTFASTRLASMQAQEGASSSTSSPTSADATATGAGGATGAQGLSDALGNSL